MTAIKYTTTHATFDGAIMAKDRLAQFKDFIDWVVDIPDGAPFIELHCYLKDDGTEVLLGNCERVEYPCDNESSVLQSVDMEG